MKNKTIVYNFTFSIIKTRGLTLEIKIFLKKGFYPDTGTTLIAVYNHGYDLMKTSNI